MTETELAEKIKTSDMYELACKTNAKMDLDSDEKDIVAQLDAHFKEVGERGEDEQHEIAAFVQKVTNRELTEAPDDLLDTIVDRGQLNDGDDFVNVVAPKNTLVAYETAKGGSVNRSHLDVSVLTPTWKNRQIETDISYADLKRNGWKTVATLTEYASAAFKNYMFKDFFLALSNAIASGADNYLNVGGSAITQAAADAIQLYVSERDDTNGVIVGYSKYIQQISKLDGFNSQEMLNEIHRTGRLGMYQGVSLYPISSAKKLGSNEKIFVDNRVFGIAGKIGVLNTQGDVTVYEDQNHSKESTHITFKNFTYGYAFNDDALENVIVAALS